MNVMKHNPADPPALPGSMLPRVRKILPVGLFAVLLGGWEIAARAGWISKLFFPAPSSIFQTLLGMAQAGSLWPDLWATLSRITAGVILGGGAGVLLGWLMGASRTLRITLDPLIAALHPLPKLAIFPIFLILLGIGEASKIALVTLAAFFPLLINTLAGVQQIDAKYWESAANYGAKGWILFRRVIIPGSLPMTLTGLLLAVNSALVVTISVEMLSAQQGLGALIWISWQTLRTEQLYAALLLIAGMGLAGNLLLTALARRMMPWREDENYL